MRKLVCLLLLCSCQQAVEVEYGTVTGKSYVPAHTTVVPTAGIDYEGNVTVDTRVSRVPDKWTVGVRTDSGEYFDQKVSLAEWSDLEAGDKVFVEVRTVLGVKGYKLKKKADNIGEVGHGS